MGMGINEKRALALGFLILFSATLCAEPAGLPGGIPDTVLKSNFEFSGYNKLEVAFRYQEPRSFTKMRNTLFLGASWRLGRSMKLRMASRYYYDFVYDIYNYDTIAARQERNPNDPLTFFERLPDEKNSNKFDLREAYLDINLKNTDFRLGKQHIVWGVLEGVRVVDELNPMDFHELILPDDLLDYRISLWSLKIDHYRDSGDYQFIWIPDMTFHKPAPSGSEWELFQDVPNTQKPQSSLRNSEVGFRWKKNIATNDIALSYFYTWDDFPAIFRFSKERIGEPEEPIVFPNYTRMSMYGLTLSRPLSRYVFKSEFSYVTGKYFGTDEVDANLDNFIDDNGAKQRSHIRWGVGIDMHISGWDVAPAFVQWEILDYDDSILQPEHDSSFNLYMRKRFKKRNGVFTLLWIYLMDMDESLLKPRLNFNITDKYIMSVGLDLFFGKRSQFGVGVRDERGGGVFAIPQDLEQRAQFFGNFNNNDRIYLEMKYAF